MSRTALAAVVVAVLLLTAGCSDLRGTTATPTTDAGQTDVLVSVENDGDANFTAEVLLFEGRLTRLNVVYDDGVTRPVENLSAVRGVYAYTWRDVVDIRVPREARSQARFGLPPSSSAATRLSAPSEETTVLVVVRREGRVVAFATAYCGSENTIEELRVTARSGTPGRLSAVALSCRAP